MKQIIVGADHGGVRLKDEIVQMLSQDTNLKVCDLGTHGNAPVDYPNIAELVGMQVARDPDVFGILVCGSGIGISIAANKVKGIRAALVHDAYTARMSRQHNNANIICLGERVIGSEVAKDAVKTFLESKFESGRHQTRIDLIASIETKC